MRTNEVNHSIELQITSLNVCAVLPLRDMRTAIYKKPAKTGLRTSPFSRHRAL